LTELTQCVSLILMATVASKLHETAREAGKQREVFVLRTRDAGRAFLEETRDAGLGLVHFLRSEARRWQRFASGRVTRLGTDVRSAVTFGDLERRLLVQMDDTLRSLDARVKRRIAALSGGGRPRTRRAKKQLARARKAKASSPALAAA
jgi:hypothetical protein